MNIILKGKRNSKFDQSVIQGGNMMNLINMISINGDHRERKAAEVNDRAMSKREYGYSTYESLEYANKNLGQNSLNLQMELMKSFVR
jgi:hypothetical protein